jgi:asparagine synthase (glutamine-hydrolysing)
VAIVDSVAEFSNARTTMNDALLSSMAGAISYENWHKMDLHVGPNLSCARVHLGITNPEKQPIFNEDNSVYIVMSGEVFGYEDEKRLLELKGHKFKINNDAEYCLHSYEEYGETFVNKLNGTFIIVLHDLRKNKIVIANDRYGLRPFYYAEIGEKFLFASEVKAIIQDLEFKREVDEEAIADFFAFGRIFGDKTLFKGIRVFPPASIFLWSEGELSIRTYWDFEFNEDYTNKQSEEDFVKGLCKVFRNAMKKRMRGKHRFGLFLSGGLDSRAIAGAFWKEGPPVRTFTYGIKGGDEARIAEAVARKAGSEHTFLELEKDYLRFYAEKGVFLTDGMLSCYHFHWVSLLPKLKKDIDVMFHGSAQDFLLGTYLSRLGNPLHNWERNISKVNNEQLATLLFKKINDVIPQDMMPLFFSKDYYHRISQKPFESVKKSLKTVKSKNPVNLIDCFFLKQYGRYHLSYQMLRNYLEDRVPGFDNDFVDFVLGIPPEFRFGTRIYYKFLTHLSPELAQIPYQKTGVPPKYHLMVHKLGFLTKQGYKVFGRRLRNLTGGRINLSEKMGYPDVDQWIRENVALRNLFESIILSSRTLKRQYYNEEYVRQMIEDHMNSKKNYGKQLCALLTIELWHRLFVDSHQENQPIDKDLVYAEDSPAGI